MVFSNSRCFWYQWTADKHCDSTGFLRSNIVLLIKMQVQNSCDFFMVFHAFINLYFITCIKPIWNLNICIKYFHLSSQIRPTTSTLFWATSDISSFFSSFKLNLSKIVTIYSKNITYPALPNSAKFESQVSPPGQILLPCYLIQ